MTVYDVGEIIWPHELIVQYVRAIQDASDRVTIEKLSESHLGRPIFAIYASSAENLARLDEIKASRSTVLNGQAPEIDLGVLQINYGVHGKALLADIIAPGDAVENGGGGVGQHSRP